MTRPAPLATVIIPAHNEAAYIGACLSALLTSEGAGAFEVLVIANACEDDTAAVAQRVAAQHPASGMDLRVIDTPKAGKPGALQIGDDAARGGIRIYLDADVAVSPGLIAALIAALDGDAPRYASGTPVIPAARSAVTRLYARFWQRLPFVREGVPGFGLFAVNAAGRARWGQWPEIISDDTFARLHFAPVERVSLPHTYSWPMVEGFMPLVRVRRRQDRGVAEIARLYPDLTANDDTRARGGLRKLGAAVLDPAGFAVYASVALCTKLPGTAGHGDWARGR